MLVDAGWCWLLLVGGLEYLDYFSTSWESCEQLTHIFQGVESTNQIGFFWKNIEVHISLYTGWIQKTLDSIAGLLIMLVTGNCSNSWVFTTISVTFFSAVFGYIWSMPQWWGIRHSGTPSNLVCFSEYIFSDEKRLGSYGSLVYSHFLLNREPRSYEKFPNDAHPSSSIPFLLHLLTTNHIPMTSTPCITRHCE